MSTTRICIIAAAILGLNACAARRHVAPSTPSAATSVQPPQPAVTSPGRETLRPAPVAKPKPNASSRAPQTAKKTAPAVTKPPAPEQVAKPTPSRSTAVTLDLNGLETQLKETDAIGFFTKISLKNQVDDLLDQFRNYYQGKSKTDMMELRRSYNLLLMKVLSLVQNKDDKLASTIAASREAIWNLLSDPQKFARLQI